MHRSSGIQLEWFTQTALVKFTARPGERENEPGWAANGHVGYAAPAPPAPSPEGQYDGADGTLRGPQA
jgi:hypothetical protein